MPAIETRSVSSLALDERNPRLPERLHSAPQSELLQFLYDQGALLELAQSFVDNGYFQHEPLIVLESDGEEGRAVVVEGNRRLATLLILLQEPVAQETRLRFRLDEEPSAARLTELGEVPCYTVSSAEEVHSFLGFRHIGGLKTWLPEAKARYLLAEVERVVSTRGADGVFTAVGRTVGSNAQGVRNPYIALKILRYARSEFGIDSSYIEENRFGVWHRCMNSPDLRTYIGIGNARTFDEIETALGDLDESALREVLRDLTPHDGSLAVLRDSRDVTKYAGVLIDPRAHKTLRQFNDLSLAKSILESAQLAQDIETVKRRVDVLLQRASSETPSADAAEPARGLERIAMALRAVIEGAIKDASAD